MAERVINGREFKCDPKPAVEALHLLGRVAKVLGPHLDIIAAFSEEDESRKMTMLADCVGRAMMSLDSSDFKDLIVDLARSCKVNNEPVVPDANVTDLEELFQVAFWALEVQFGPFLRGGALKDIISRMPVLMTGQA